MALPIEDKYSRDNAHQLAFLANEYPDKTITEIAEMFQLGPLDFNVAVWRAIDMGFFTVDEKTGKITIHDIDRALGGMMGEATDRLIEGILYTLSKLNEDEADIEENYLMNWCNGYRTQDVLCALKWMLQEELIVSYELENTTVDKASKKGKKRGKKDKEIKDVYTFYTLPLNKDKHWGLKQFEDKDRVTVVEK